MVQNVGFGLSRNLNVLAIRGFGYLSHISIKTESNKPINSYTCLQNYFVVQNCLILVFELISCIPTEHHPNFTQSGVHWRPTQFDGGRLPSK